MATLPEIAAENKPVRDILANPRVLHTEAVRRLSDLGVVCTESSVRRWRSANDWIREEVQEQPESQTVGSVKAEEDTTGLTVYHDSWPVQLGEDLSPLLAFFGYDPQHFIVVDDSVKMSKWQQSKGTEDGGRDVIWLYSYKARFEKIRTPINEMEDLDSVVASIRAPKRLIRRTLGVPREPVWYVHQQGDEQIGKKEGGGLAGVVQRTTDAVEQSVDRLHHLLKSNPGVRGIIDVSNGDTVENIFGHYPSQQRTTDTLRKQFKGGRDLDLFRTEALAEFGMPMHKVYCTDNHGEIRQTIGLAPYTSESDNLTLILAESVRDVLDRSAISDQITWHIPHDQWWTTLTVDGINLAVGHGHKAKGSLEKWVKDQRDYLHFHFGFKTHLALLGHRHHYLAQDVNGTTMIQTPSLDGGSPFFEAMAGGKSRPGVVTYLAGAHFNQYHSDLVVL